MRENSGIGLAVMVILAAWTGLSQMAFSGEWDRQGHGDRYGYFESIPGDEFTGANRTADIESGWVLGYGWGRHFNEHFFPRIEAYIGQQERSATEDDVTVTLKRGYLIGVNLNADVFLAKGPVAPYLTAGIGYLLYDEPDPAVYTETTYIGESASHRENRLRREALKERLENDLNAGSVCFSFGIGLRWMLTDRVYMNLLYRSFWSEIKDVDDMAMLSGYQIAIGALLP